MPTVVHVIDGASPQATPATLALMAATVRHVEGLDHHVVLLGGGELERSAREAGIGELTRIGVAGQRAVLGTSPLRRWLRARYPEGIDLVHCWSGGAFSTVATLQPAAPRLLSLTQLPDGAALRRLAAHLGRRQRAPTAVAVLSESMRAGLLAGGGSAMDITVISPGIDAELLSRCERDALRARWPLGTSATTVIALLSDPPTAADARKANLGMGLAHESLLAALGRRPDMRLLMHPAQLHRMSAYRLLVNYGVAELIVQEPAVATPWRMLGGCDAALIPAEHAGGLATAWAMAAGVAIVAEDQSPADELLRHDRNALVAQRDQPKRLAHRLHQLIQEPAQARRLGEQARRDAQEVFAASRYGARVSELYRSMLGEGNLAQALKGAWSGGG